MEERRVCRRCSTVHPLTFFPRIGSTGYRRHVCPNCRKNPLAAATPRQHYVGRPELKATEKPSVIDVAWAAGIYEGEGTIAFSSGVRIVVTQKDPWLLYKLKRLFGGTVYRSKEKPPSIIHRWLITGARARGFFMTIYLFLSPRRREQGRKVMGV